MIKELIKILVKLVEAKLKKTGVEEEILKNKEYFDTAKKVWNVIEEDFRIEENIKKKLGSKADEFDRRLLKRFPELSENDVADLRQAVAGEINQGKQSVLDNSEILRKLQSENEELKARNSDLENKIAAISSYIPKEKEEQGQ